MMEQVLRLKKLRIRTLFLLGIIFLDVSTQFVLAQEAWACHRYYPKIGVNGRIWSSHERSTLILELNNDKYVTYRSMMGLDTCKDNFCVQEYIMKSEFIFNPKESHLIKRGDTLKVGHDFSAMEIHHTLVQSSTGGIDMARRSNGILDTINTSIEIWVVALDTTIMQDTIVRSLNFTMSRRYTYCVKYVNFVNDPIKSYVKIREKLYADTCMIHCLGQRFDDEYVLFDNEFKLEYVVSKSKWPFDWKKSAANRAFVLFKDWEVNRR